MGEGGEERCGFQSGQRGERGECELKRRDEMKDK